MNALEILQKLKNVYPMIKGDIEMLGLEAMWGIIFLMMLWHVFDLVKLNYIRDEKSQAKPVYLGEFQMTKGPQEAKEKADEL